MPGILANEAYLVTVLAQLAVIILVGRAMNRLFVRLGQPGAVGEIVGGLLLGPSFAGALFPDLQGALFAPETARTLYVLGQVGLILLMFEIGADFDYGHLADRRYRRAVLLTAAVSVSLPFAAGVALGLGTHSALAADIDRTLYALFCGVALAITAVPILGRILREFGLNRAPIGVVAISAAALNDVVGWLLLATISALAMAQLSDGFLPLRLAALVALALALRFLAAPLVARLVAGDRLAGSEGPLPSGLMALAIAFALGLAIVTEAIGVFAIFGGFLAGLCFHPHARFVARWKDSVGRFLIVFFLPIFFTLTGLRTDIFGLELADIPLLLLVLALAILAKVLPCYVAGRLSGFSRTESWLLGGLMNTRALMELVVLNIAFDLGLLPQKMFTMLVLMAVVTTLMTGPILRLLLPRMGLALPAPGRSAEA